MRLERPTPAQFELSIDHGSLSLVVEALDLASQQPDAGYLLPSGVRVIDLVPGTGPQPEKGSRVWCHYKMWANNFRSGPVADLSFLDGRPYDWTLGESTDRIPIGVDQGTLGMREGGAHITHILAAHGGLTTQRILSPSMYNCRMAEAGRARKSYVWRCRASAHQSVTGRLALHWSEGPIRYQPQCLRLRGPDYV